MRRKRRNHSSVFKAKVALATIRGDKPLAEQFEVRPTQIQDWRRKLLGNAAELFERNARPSEESEHKVKELHAKIGQLTMERDFLEQGLKRIHGPSAKR